MATVDQMSTSLSKEIFDMLFVRIFERKVWERTILVVVQRRWKSSVVDQARDSARSCTFLHIEIRIAAAATTTN
jgi:hypothetical protein